MTIEWQAGVTNLPLEPFAIGPRRGEAAFRHAFEATEENRCLRTGLGLPPNCRLGTRTRCTEALKNPDYRLVADCALEVERWIERSGLVRARFAESIPSASRPCPDPLRWRVATHVALLSSGSLLS